MVLSFYIYIQTDQKIVNQMLKTIILIIIIQMKEQTMDPINPQRLLIPTVGHSSIMTQEFISVYKQTLRYSNLNVDTQLRYRNVPIHQNDHMHELYTVSSNKLPHLVLLHGYGGTSLTFVRTFQHLKDHFQVHALDTFGVGLSSRGNWSDKMTMEQAAQYYINAIEQWRKTVKIQDFILAGHSFGGYISALYYEKYRKRVTQLILLSPAGAGKIAQQTIQARARNARCFFWFGSKIFGCGFRPAKIMNTWIIGPKFIQRLLSQRLKLPQDQKNAWKRYLSHIIAIDDNSQGGFYLFFGWPLQPIRSIQQILLDIQPSKQSKIKIDIFFGDNDWMNQQGGKRLARDFKNIFLHEIQSAGHQMIFDNPLGVTGKIKDVVNR